MTLPVKPTLPTTHLVRVNGGYVRPYHARSDDPRLVAMTVPIVLDLVDQLPLRVDVRRIEDDCYDSFRVWRNRRGYFVADNWAEPAQPRQVIPGIR